MGTPVLEENKGFDWSARAGHSPEALEVVRLFRRRRHGDGQFWSPCSPSRFIEATARVEIDPSGEKFSLDTSGGSGATMPEYLETQAQVLQGDSLAVVVVRKLHLDQNPAVMGKLTPPRQAPERRKRPTRCRLPLQESVALANFKKNLKVKRDTASRLILVSFDQSGSPARRAGFQHPGAVFYRSELSEPARCQS